MVQVRRRREGRQRCPLCQERLGDESPYACPGCQTRYHPECVDELGGCSTMGCAQKGQRVAFGASPTRHPKQPAALRDTLRGPNVEHLPDGRIKLEIESWRESGLLWLTILLVAAALFVAVAGEGLGFLRWPAAMTSLGAALLSGVGLAHTDDYYLLDPGSEAIFLRYQFLEWVRLKRVATFGEVAGFAVQCREHRGKNSHWWEYALLMVKNDGRKLLLSDFERDQRMAMNSLAHGLARELDVEYWPGRAESPARVIRDRATGQVRVSYEGYASNAMVVLGLLVMILGTLSMAGLFFAMLNKR